jgi:hypothetical protein
MNSSITISDIQHRNKFSYRGHELTDLILENLPGSALDEQKSHVDSTIEAVRTERQISNTQDNIITDRDIYSNMHKSSRVITPSHIMGQNLKSFRLADEFKQRNNGQQTSNAT